MTVKVVVKVGVEVVVRALGLCFHVGGVVVMVYLVYVLLVCVCVCVCGVSGD